MARANGNNGYLGKLRYLSNRTVSLTLSRLVNNVDTALTTAVVPGLTVNPGQLLRLKLEAEGTAPTALRVKAWPVAGSEPAAWGLTGTDFTASLQTPASAGLNLYVSGSATATSVLSFDRFTVSRLGGPPPVDQSPTAAIGTPTIDGRTVNLSGTGSADPDGTIASYAWNYGDATTGTGPTPSHTYTADGTYTITLTVTDNDGTTNSTTRQITVTAPPPNQSPTAAIGTPTIDGRTVNLSGTGSADPDGTIASYAWNYGDATTGTGPTPS